MLRGLFVCGIAVFGLVLFTDADSQGGDKKKPTSVKVVMQKAMKGGLCSKVVSGKATDEEKKQLIVLFTDMAAAPCPKGEEADWKTRTKALLDAAKADDTKALKKAADCKGCHSTHK